MKKLLPIVLLIICTPAYSGFFDQLADEAKKTLENGVENVINATSGSNDKNLSPPESNTSQNTTTANKSAAPVYDRDLVRNIQQQLNTLGYNSGKPDGIYGNGTHKAISSFQKDNGLAVDGKPSVSLLTKLKTMSSQQAPKETSSSAIKPKDSRELAKAAYRATLHYYPEVLNDEKWLKNVASRLYPDESVKFSKNEFTWQKSKQKLKERILKEIENPPLTLTASWTNNSGGYLAIGNYDFDKKAFKIKMPKMYPIGVGDNRPYFGRLRKAIMTQGWLAVPQNAAEKIVQNNARRLYGEYQYTIIGAKKYSNNGQVKLISNFKIEKIDLYSYINNKYQYVASIQLPDLSVASQKAVKTEQNKPVKKVVEATPPVKKPTPKPSISNKAVEPVQAKIDDPYVRANKGQAFGPEVVGIQLGMTFQEAEKVIAARKSIMKKIDGKPPRPFSAARVFVLKPGDEIIELLALNTLSGNRIASIYRTVYFDPDNPPTQTAITSSVVKKYGTPTYTYEVNGQFNRAWYTHADSTLIKQSGPHMRACEHVVSGSASDTWLENGKYYQWTMPWRDKTYMGVRASKKIKGGVSLDDDKVFSCGPVTEIDYSKNSGMLIGPSLKIHVYDPAWAIADFIKSEKKEASQGAKDLDL